MVIKQFEDDKLAHFSYAIKSEDEIVLVDPGRNPEPYYAYARNQDAKIVAVLETHPHADFVSSHLEIHKATGATVYCSELLGAEYPHYPLRDGDDITFGQLRIKALLTPGHSPDSMSFLLYNQDGKPEAIFSGDTLFIGDCGRPDLRESAGSLTRKREELAAMMYHSLHNHYLPLPDSVILYPAHGAGSLCGKGMSSATSSTMGEEKKHNWSLNRNLTEGNFVDELTEGQPFVPAYFSYDVDLNKLGAPDYQPSVNAVPMRDQISANDTGADVVVDARKQDVWKQDHIKGSFNIQEGKRFETWLGSIVRPQERFYLIANSKEEALKLVERAAKIGYERQVAAAGAFGTGNETWDPFDLEDFRNNPDKYTIVDVRNPAETEEGLYFEGAITIPLYELRTRANEVPRDKQVVVHCKGGYRSAAGSSILAEELDAVRVFDLGSAIEEFK